MSKKEFKPAKPSHRGIIRVSAWTNKDENGKTYLSIKLDNNFRLYEEEGN